MGFVFRAFRYPLFRRVQACYHHSNTPLPKVPSMKPFLYALVLMSITASSAPAGEMIRKACLKAGRDGATTQLCTCIQSVADLSLKRKDQRKAAGFFKDPHRAQVVRQSDNPRNAAFWQRYKAFGLEAEETCTPEDSS